VPILVGGTGLYIRTLLDGIAPVPVIDPEVRARVRAMPVAEAYACLLTEDPARAAALAPADTTRIARALEVVRATGHPLAHWQARREGGIGSAVALHPLVLLPERAEVYRRCDSRFAAMLDQGASEEVAALLARGLDPDLPVMRAIGVAQVATLLNGAATRASAEAAGGLATRRYVKRQFTWLRHQAPAHWPRATELPYNFDADFEILLRI
jgi:tRNA dimethylallyltransferase